MANALEGLKALIVEDEPMVALVLEDMLADLGVAIQATASSLPQAVFLASSVEVDVALLDVNLAGQMSYPAAETLALRGIPVVFMTGYAKFAPPPLLGNALVLRKPYTQHDVRKAMESVLVLRRAA